MQSLNLKKYILQTPVLMGLGLFIFLLFFKPIPTGDVWWHLSTGKWIVEHLQVPHEDIFPFAQERIPWSCHNEWLGCVILYLIVKVGGLLALKVFRALFFVIIISILVHYSYKRLPFPFLIILALLVTFGLSSRWEIKPDMFNLFFIPIYLINLFEYEDTGNRKKLWILPVISFIWFNIHIGSFVYGLPVLFIFLLSACIRYFNLNSKNCTTVEKLKAGRQIQDLALTALACLVSFVVNPYGLEGFLYPFKVFLLPNFIGFYKFGNLIQELQPPGYIFTSLNYFYYHALFILGLLVLFLNKKNNFTLAVLLFISLFVFLYSSRNAAFFTLGCFYVIVAGPKWIRFNEIWGRLQYSKIINYLLCIGIALFLLFQILSVWSQKSYYNGHLINTRCLVVDPMYEDIIELLIKNKLTGPVFNQDILGGQIIWLGYPHLKPFRDGRNNSMERMNNYMAILGHPQAIWPNAQRDYDFKIVILNTYDDLQLSFLRYLGKQPLWQLISINGPYAIYVKRNEYNLSEKLDSFEVLLKSHDVSIDDLRGLKNLTDKKNVSILQDYFSPSAEDVAIHSSFYAFYTLGFKGAAVEDLFKTLKICDRPGIRYSAIFILKQLGKGGV